MPGNDPYIPPRPNDPIFSVIWDMNYGPAKNINPLHQLTTKIDSLKVDLNALTTLASSIDKVNKNIERTSTHLLNIIDKIDRTEKIIEKATSTMKDSNILLSNTNKTIRELLEQFKK